MNWAGSLLNSLGNAKRELGAYGEAITLYEQWLRRSSAAWRIR